MALRRGREQASSAASSIEDNPPQSRFCSTPLTGQSVEFMRTGLDTTPRGPRCPIRSCFFSCIGPVPRPQSYPYCAPLGRGHSRFRQRCQASSPPSACDGQPRSPCCRERYAQHAWHDALKPENLHVTQLIIPRGHRGGDRLRDRKPWQNGSGATHRPGTSVSLQHPSIEVHVVRAVSHDRRTGRALTIAYRSNYRGSQHGPSLAVGATRRG